MSQEDTCKPRFKGIENFLRRIAFNLGNSPSQTEVKIISCIPIDVTDLQQKILLLEKELSDAKKQKSVAKHKIKIDCNRLDRRVMYDSSAANQSVAISQCDNSPSLDYTLDRNFSNVTTELSYSKPHIEAIYERVMSEQTMKSKWDKRKFNANKCVKNIFRKRKKQTQNRGQTQFVYYTHTDYGPNLPEMNKLSYSYLSDVFRKHYDPKLVLRECSDTSHFSEPVCRDLSRSKKSALCDSEVCSCCHGRFQNVDIYMNDMDEIDAPVSQFRKKEKVKNEPNIVDLLPVKEKSTENKPKSRDDGKRLKAYYKMRNAEWSLHHDAQHTHCYNYTTDNNREFKVNKQMKCKNTCQKHTTHSKAGHRETTNVYKGSYIPVKIHKNKVEKSLKENISSTQIKTAIYDCTKTEAMLNEIKKMLRTVLTEIKTNTEMRYIKGEKTKRDAVVQNDSSRNDMQRSTFLHSFMYNTSNYCTNPYLLPYAGQVPLTQYCFSNMPFNPIKCPMKASPQSVLCPKSATTRSTNTDNIENMKPDNKETGELIKEIYKSVKTGAVTQSNVESSNDELKTATKDSTSDTKINCACRDVSQNVSNTKKDAQVEALLSSLTSYTASCNVVYTAIAPKSGYDVKENDAHRFTKHDDISEEDEYTETVISSSYVTESSKVPKKTGVLAKMLSVFKKNKSNRDEETEMSDTDDYETVYTVYTDKANNTPKIKRPVGINIRVPPSRNKNKRRSEEECRKQWIDDLLNEQSRYYAPKKNTQSFKSYPNAVYGRDYEARAAFVVPNRNYNIPNQPKYENANKMCRLPIERKKISYLKNAKLMRCGRDWKKFIMES